VEKIIEKVGDQAPSLVVLVGVVWLFLKHMTEIRIATITVINQMQREWTESLKGIHAENMEARALSREAIKDNTTATRELTVKIEKKL
jgi:hypothetical protein